MAKVILSPDVEDDLFLVRSRVTVDDQTEGVGYTLLNGLAKSS